MTSFPSFDPSDFAAYSPKHQRDREANAWRLRVRRKLGELGKAAKAHLKKECGLNLSCRTNLNHPYKFNFGRVQAQWAYLSRSPKDKKALVERVGPAIGEDVDTHYIQTTFVLSVDREGFEIALRIHPQAWWDSQNLKNRVLSATAEMDDWTETLNEIGEGYVLSLHNWKKEYPCGDLYPDQIENFFSFFEPGNHSLSIRHRIPAKLAVGLGPELGPLALEGLSKLAPAYQFLTWTEENNWLFDAEGKVRHGS
ncbi:MAG TPA: hypothetical protein ENK02_13510 [Planctomycetes bacterium]|nr:hypothetical protein [Planctomycetota bacterium]